MMNEIDSTRASAPRVWPAAIIVAAMWGAILLPGRLFPDSMMMVINFFMLGVMLGPVLLLLWWLFFSRVSWGDVGVGLLAAAVGMGLIFGLGHRSMIPLPLMVHVGPIVATVAVIWLALTPFVGWRVGRIGLPIVVVAACAAFLTVRFEGTDGKFAGRFAPRWVESAEDQFLREHAQRTLTGAEPFAPMQAVATADDWPAFRGVHRDSSRPGVRIRTDWNDNPPTPVWKQRVGPGWSSFAVVGDRLFTQEQRGPNEAVVCYDAGTGREIWTHAYPARFYEPIAGYGPRATPTFENGKIYAQGATGNLVCLNADTGAEVWSRDIIADHELKVPEWGFSASPLVVGDIVAVGGGMLKSESNSIAILAYDAATGAPKWTAGQGPISYCSPQLSTIDGVPQIVIVTNEGVVSADPKTGRELWSHDWLLKGTPRVVQPAVVGDDVLIGTSFDMGTRRLHVSRAGADWQANEVWTTRAIRPYYNDFVIHDGHIFGFDNAFFACIDLKDGKRKWRERGYDNGQVLLLPDDDQLLILAENGDVALVAADPAGHKELGRFSAVEGKTWNHPVIARGRLFVRNDQEAACYDLRVKGEATKDAEGK